MLYSQLYVFTERKETAGNYAEIKNLSIKYYTIFRAVCTYKKANISLENWQKIRRSFVISYRSRPQVREKILVVSDLRKKNSAQSAMSELLSKSNAASTGKKNDKVRRQVPVGKVVHVQPAAQPRQARPTASAPQRQISRSISNPRIYQKIPAQSSQPERTAGNNSNPRSRIMHVSQAGRRAAKASFKVARAVVTTVVLLCLCTGIISAVLILNPGEDNGVAVDTAIGVPAAARTVNVEAEEELPAAEPALLMAADVASEETSSAARHTVTFTFYDRESLVCTSSEKTVGELIDLMDIQLSDVQRANVDTEAVIQADTIVSVDAVTYDTVAVNTAIPYETRYVDVQTIPRGTTQTYQQGANGTQTTEYQVTYVNGVEVDRVQTGEYVSAYPTENVIYRGVGGTLTVGGQTYSYSYYLDCRSTVYTGGGTTASGLPATEQVIAVDPRVIPLGSTCYISGSYCEVGFRTAADTGGGIKGNIIDIYFETSNPYFAGYGWRNVRVYIFD